MRSTTLTLLALAALWCVRVEAQTPPTCLQPIADPVPRNSVRWSWTNPTTNTDGSVIKQPITATFYENGTKVCQFPMTNKLTGAASWNALSVGAHTWAVTASTSDGESTAVMVMKTIVPAPPNPVTNLLVDPQSLTAWTVNTTDGAITALEVGKIPVGTKCDMTSMVQPYGMTTMLYHVPESAVQYLPNITALVTYAACSGG